MKRLAIRAKALWWPVLYFGSAIAFIVAGAIFLVLCFATGMAFCFVIFFLASVDDLVARRENQEREHSLLYDLRELIRDVGVANESDAIG